LAFTNIYLKLSFYIPLVCVNKVMQHRHLKDPLGWDKSVIVAEMTRIYSKDHTKLSSFGLSHLGTLCQRLRRCLDGKLCSKKWIQFYSFKMVIDLKSFFDLP
jgi:hypothetical protein